MVSNAYERFQLDLIAMEYRREGYEVVLDSSFTGVGWSFDAIARRAGSPEAAESLIFIELVNSSVPERELLDRQRKLEAMSERYPKAIVDLRVIDPAEPLWALHRVSRGRYWPTEQIPDVSVEGLPPDAAVLVLWSRHATLLRQIADLLQSEPTPFVDLLSLYNALLMADLIQPPEEVELEVYAGLFEVYGAVIAAIQGLSVSTEEVEQLRLHTRSLQRQIEAHTLPDLKPPNLSGGPDR